MVENGWTREIPQTSPEDAGRDAPCAGGVGPAPSGGDSGRRGRESGREVRWLDCVGQDRSQGGGPERRGNAGRPDRRGCKQRVADGEENAGRRVGQGHGRDEPAGNDVTAQRRWIIPLLSKISLPSCRACPGSANAARNGSRCTC